MENQIKYKLRISTLREKILFIENFLDGLFNFLSLKKTRRFWGVVYDSVSKQPLDPVIVKLIYADGREAETCVTDLNGGYGFLAQPGNFKIFARKANYVFPSQRIKGANDGIYENLYHGEFFELTDSADVVAPNIPMDPIENDWNQQAKSQMFKKYPFIKLLFKRLVAVAFWYGLFFLALGIWQAYPNIPFYFWFLVSIYIVLIGLSVLAKEPRLWGVLKSHNKHLIPVGLSLELHNPKFPDIAFGKSTVRRDGKFLLRANSGNYLLQIFDQRDEKIRVLLASLPVKVNKHKVLNSTIIVS